jgi:hypothetical protein
VTERKSHGLTQHGIQWSGAHLQVRDAIMRTFEIVAGDLYLARRLRKERAGSLSPMLWLWALRMSRILAPIFCGILLSLGCAHSKPVPIAWISHGGVAIHGSPGTWLTPQMAADMEAAYLSRRADFEVRDAMRCIYGLDIHIVDRLPSGAGAHYEPTVPRLLILAKKRATAMELNERGERTYEWLLELVWRNCL